MHREGNQLQRQTGTGGDNKERRKRREKKKDPPLSITATFAGTASKRFGKKGGEKRNFRSRSEKKKKEKARPVGHVLNRLPAMSSPAVGQKEKGKEKKEEIRRAIRKKRTAFQHSR